MSASLNFWLIAPIVIPSLAAPFLILALRHDLKSQRIFSALFAALLLAVAIGLYGLAQDGIVRPYLLGAWPAPFGIVLVLDRLSATMLLLTAVLGFAVVLYSMAGWDRRGRHFHPLFQFQLMGVNGAFLTGDLFNLFVFFEVMLISSYGLMLHGGGEKRLKGGFHYIAINLVGSTLFLFAVGVIYAVTGTLNMADLAQKASQIAPGDVALLRTGALLLLIVFALKAALAPLHWWLPTAYAAAPGPSAALFMIMTKIGAYAILRTYTLIFGADAGPVADIAAQWILPAGLATLVVGALGALASKTLLMMACFAIVWSMGSLFVALGLFNEAGIGAALYYLLHSTLTGAALFLLADMLARRRAGSGDQLEPGPRLERPSLFAGLFFVGAIAMTGMPPLSGFIGKLFILEAGRGSSASVWIWGIVLSTSLVVTLAFARAGSVLFWKIDADAPLVETKTPAPVILPVAVCAALLGATVLLSVMAGPVKRELDAIARHTLDPQIYVRAVLAPSAPLASGR